MNSQSEEAALIFMDATIIIRATNIFEYRTTENALRFHTFPLTYVLDKK